VSTTGRFSGVHRGSKLLFNQEEQAAIAKLPAEQKSRALRKVLSEMARIRTVAFHLTPWESVTLVRRLPIDDSLTYETFIRTLEDVNGATMIAFDVIWTEFGDTFKTPQAVSP
jgi:hypothetical protein